MGKDSNTAGIVSESELKILSNLEIAEDFVPPDFDLSCFDEVFRGVDRRTNVNSRSAIIRYGWSYEPPIKRLDRWPEFIDQIRSRLLHPCPVDVCSVTVNEYKPGHSIAPHIDSLRFGDCIQIVSFGCHATMRFASPRGTFRDVPLNSGQLLAMSGEARTKWTHEVLHVEGLRYSVVFRIYDQRIAVK